MGIYQQLKGLLRSQYIQMKRNFFLSLVEILCPIILLLLFLLLRLLFSSKEEKFDSIFDNDLDFFYKYSTNLTNYNPQIGQNENSNIDINTETPIPYYYFLAHCRLTKHIAIIGKDFPQKLIDKISFYFWELNYDVDEKNFFKKFTSINEFEEYMTSKEYGTDEISYPKICFGISQTDKFKFGIHYNTKNIESENSNEMEDLLAQESPHIPEMKSNKNEKIRIQENLKFFDYYKNSGYLMTMKLIYDYMLQEITNNPYAEINYSIIGMKYDNIKKDNFHRFLSLLGFFIIISYAIPFSINIYKEIHFRETKKKEYLKSMGVKEIIFFMTSFVKSLIINIFQSIFCALFSHLILKQSQYIYLFFIFLLFGLVMFSMVYFFQSFLQESRMGVIISLLIYCIMSFFYLPLNSPIADKSFIYLICIFFPPANLLLGMNNFYVYEKEFSPLNNRVNLDISQITISLMITFLFLNFIIYLFLGFIISQLFCYEYGVNKSICCSNKKNRININIDDINSNNNINKNYKGISKKTSEEIKIKSNPPPKIKIGLDYIDENDEFDEQNNQNINLEKEKYIKQFKYGLYDFVNTLSQKKSQIVLEAKKENLRQSLFKIIGNEKDTDIKNDKKEKKEDLNDECEINLENQIEIQEIRNKRRFHESTMFNLKPEGKIINDNIKMNNIQNIMDSFIKEIPKEKLPDDISKKINLNDIKFEEKEIKDNREDFHVGPRLEIKNIIKRYGNEKVLALDNLSFTLYENEIYGLLGQNGAGKSTFISILSGLIEANSGSIKYKLNKDDKGLDVRDPQGNKQFRKILGVCPQNNNILYEELTVKENLEIFCLLKYDKKEHGNNEKYYIEKEVKELINKFELEKVENELSKNISGGLKRRLCIAIAFCGRSKVIILDEPTGGIDILSRKKLMNILKKLKNDNKIILLITHFMDETSFLADQIGILKNGKLLCSGTNRELIDNYGNYITIQINKGEDGTIKNLINYIKTNIVLKDNNNNISRESDLINDTYNHQNMIDPSDASISFESNNSSFINKEKMEIKKYKERVVIKIPVIKFDFSKSYDLLKNIEEITQTKDFRIIKDQLEDAFINVIKEKADSDDKKDYLIFSEMDNYVEKFNSFGKFINELKILFFKRGFETLRNKKSFILEILFPILLTLIACLVTYIELLEENRTTFIELNNFSNDTQTIYYDYSNIININDYNSILYGDSKEKLKNYNFQPLRNNLGNGNNALQNLISYLNIIYEYNKKEKIENNFANYYLINADKEKNNYEFATFISTKQRHSTIVYSNYILNNIIKFEMKQNNQYKDYVNNVGITNSPFLISYEEKKDKKTRNGSVLVFFVSIALALFPSNFITIIIREKENKSKHLQLLSGLSIYTYWINNYIFELIKYYVVVGICFILITIFEFYEKYLIIFYFFYGPALVSFTYVVSYFIEFEGLGQTIILLINLIFGALCGTATLILRTNKDMKNLGIPLSYFLRIVPSFCISYGFSQLISKKILFTIDYFKNKDDYETIKKKFNDSSTIIKDNKYVSIDIVFLVSEIFLYTGLLIFLENKDYFLWKLGFFKNNIVESDQKPLPRNKINHDTIIAGTTKSTTRKIINKQKEKNNSLDVNKLKKDFKFRTHFFNCCKKKEIKHVLTNLSFEVCDGECFGLLGSNGQGKTTTFKCLCKEIIPDGGSIKIDDINIFDFSVKEKPIIGYCPQFDSIFEFLTVSENLKYYGRLKGINEFCLNKFINIILKKLNLTKYINKLSGELSGGNKRKLSVGISIIIKPCVILLDEPSTGMDPYTRSLLLQLLHRAYLKNYSEKDKNDLHPPRSIVLTTHSIEEAESLCDKIGILVNGKFDVDGKIFTILQDYSRGIELNIEFEKPSPENLKKQYGNILKEELMSEDDIKTFLRYNKKGDYCNYLKNNHFGRDILKVISKKKQINKFTILRWIKYMDYLNGLAKEIKKYFDSIKCIKFKLNNYILKIENFNNKDKNDNYLFGIIEQFKDKYNIVEYSYALTTLESIFIECNKIQDENEAEKHLLNISL